MVLIVGGIAATAAGALTLYGKMQEHAYGDPAEIVRKIRQTTGVVLAVANFIRACLDALQLINRPVATATAGGAVRTVIGHRAGDVAD